jgi:hypothetical protein
MPDKDDDKAKQEGEDQFRDWMKDKHPDVPLPPPEQPKK